MQSLPQHTSCLFSMPLNEDIVNIEKPTFVADDFSRLFYIHRSFRLKIQYLHK